MCCRSAVAANQNLAVVDQGLSYFGGGDLDQFRQIIQRFLAGLQAVGEMLVDAFLQCHGGC